MLIGHDAAMESGVADQESGAIPVWEDLAAARERIRGAVLRTPVLESHDLARETGAARLFLKCENLQWTGAFKVRGALNAVLGLSAEEAVRGLVTHSSGNHGAALAWAGGQRAVAVSVVMPEDSPPEKVQGVRRQGGQVEFSGVNPGDRESTVAALAARTGAVMVHPYDDARIVCGQATATMELLEDAAELDLIVVPVGGGALVSGAILAVQGMPGVRGVEVIGAEPALADDAYRSWKTGKRMAAEASDTIADGLRAGLGRLNFAIISRGIRTIVPVSEEAIRRAMALLFRWSKVVAEPSGAVGLAALLEHEKEFSGRRVGVILSGGNIELERFSALASGTPGNGLGER
ncbi:MAG TPA: threonine/serine dehydratase [Verrucomicrobiales bacterium]|nr:threonine/serine dehydratase [Verrucomicrobiales bacterium]